MYSMNYIAKIISNFRLFYNEINAATLTGAIDVIVIEQPDSSFTCSPFHVRFGKLGVLRSRAKVVDIEINGEPREIHMKLGDSGEAFFVEEVSSNGSPTDTEIPPHLACSPIPDNCFPPPKFNLLSDLPQEQREKILIDSVLSIEREKWEQMSALPPDQREKFLIEQFSDLPAEHREKWLQIASLTAEERDEMFKESFGIISPEQKQQMIREQYSALKTEDKERLFKENFPELSIEQRQNFEKALLSDWKEKEEKWEEKHDKNDDEEIFDMDAISDEQPKSISCPKSFVAVTSSERIRKISVVKNDFRPITDDHQNINKEKSSDESNSSLGKKNLKEENVDETKSNNSTKRKRKRKSIMKKKGSQRKTSNGNTSQTELSETDAIFTEESISETIFKGPPPMTEEETNTVPESATSSQDIIEKRPETDFHFFSDSEVTKNKDSRPCSPVQSDTEFEVRKITQDGSEREDDKGHQQSWRWGELPSPPPEPAHMSHRNSLNSLATASQPNNGKTVDEEDTESGNGPSLPQSPNSVEGAIGGPKSLDSDFEEPKHSIFDNSIEISLSLCGGLDSENGPSKEAFNENLLHFEDVCTDPKLYENPNLVVKINGKFYNWTTACRIVLTYVVFQRHLPQSVIENLYMSLPVHEDKKRQSSDKSESRSGYSSWFSWRRSTQPSKKPQDTSQNDEIAVQIPDQSVEVKTVTNDELSSANREIKTEQNTDSSSSTEIMEIISCTRLPTASNETTLTETEKTREGEGEGYSGGEDSDSNHNEPTGVKIPVERRPYYESTEKYRKTLRLSSEQIASLDLKDGANEVVFSVTTAYQGTKRCKCHIYKWKWDDKIVISDIDGTITKSDVLGHILPIVGKDWAQSGVAQLFTKIKNNGYKLLYLSARAIGQAGGTREYLRNLRQGDLTLPEGPLLLNPTSLILAFHREVIEKKPEEFKISCLKDIQALFPEGSEPFYAGYGNRINDVWAYRAVGIPIMRIFTINHRGELKHELTQTFQSSYSNMSFIVDQVFPARREDATDEFSNFAYWRDPIPEVPKLEELYTQALII
ncbi:PREDICTED: phosphatidate phosphatase LPIN3 isoform X4 [Trachymyrmex septentrionalis]|uniref:phosphatidate phosphatase LPIN3 isoform X4 n=1 Tax=Trachymyrmex septentrionalis TaxID=34720 RepID=UPI00084F7DE5|nr:PREDICTED: phosphatidate phosphatase LPIN3 isoform X4 [Trachymyrmex septentrionalis]